MSDSITEQTLRQSETRLKKQTEYLEETLHKLQQTAQLVQTEKMSSLRQLVAGDETAIKAINLHEGIDSALLLLQLRLKEKPDYPTIQVMKDYSEPPLVNCYVGQMNQVFINLLTNAIDALEDAASSKNSKASQFLTNDSNLYSSQAGLDRNQHSRQRLRH